MPDARGASGLPEPSAPQCLWAARSAGGRYGVRGGQTPNRTPRGVRAKGVSRPSRRAGTFSALSGPGATSRPEHFPRPGGSPARVHGDCQVGVPLGNTRSSPEPIRKVLRTVSSTRTAGSGTRWILPRHWEPVHPARGAFPWPVETPCLRDSPPAPGSLLCEGLSQLSLPTLEIERAGGRATAGYACSCEEWWSRDAPLN